MKIMLLNCLYNLQKKDENIRISTLIELKELISLRRN